MPKLTTLQTSFATGETDPTLRSQVDLKAYAGGSTRMRDMWRRSTGGVERRPGWLDANELLGRTRLEPFEFSSTQRYLVGFRDEATTYWDVNGAYLSSDPTPWVGAQVDELTTTQQGDFMVVCHRSVPPRLLKRIGSNLFTNVALTFELSIDGRRLYAPFYKFAAADATIKPSGNSGSITLTSSTNLFTADYVGLRLRIYDIDVLITAVTSATVATGTVQGELKGKYDIDPFKTTRGSTKVEMLHVYHGLKTGEVIAISGANGVGKIPASYFNGSFAVTVLDDNRYTIELGTMSYPVREDLAQDGVDETTTYTSAHDSEDGGGSNVTFTVAGAATRNWLEPAFSAVRGWPGACSFHEGRLWLGGTPSLPDGHFGSNALAPFRFEVGKGYDGDSVQLTAGSEDASEVRHIVSNVDLQVFSAVREAVWVTRDDEAITPTNSRVRSQSGAGCSTIQPVNLDGVSLFVQENGLSVSEFSVGEDGYRARPVSVLAGHLIRSPVSATASQGTVRRSEQFAFFVNADGTLAVYHSNRAEGIAGWSLWSLGAGVFRSVCALGNFLYACVEVRGVFRLYRLGDDPLDLLDGMVRHVSDAPTTAWVLDPRVRGRTCAIVTELGYHGLVAVPANGVITLSVEASTVCAGDAFLALVETLPPRLSLPSGEQTGLLQRLVRSIVEFDETVSARVGGIEVGVRLVTDDLEGAPTPLSGPYETRHLGYDRNPTLIIDQVAPLFMRVLGVTQEIKV